MARRALITGITGQDGSYLAELLLEKGYEVHGMVRRSSSFNTARIDHVFSSLNLHFADLTDAFSVQKVVLEAEPDEIYNLGAQSHVKVAFEQPIYSVQTVAMGALHVLEAARLLDKRKAVRVYQASSSEMFGDVLQTPQTEMTPFRPQSPYACAKVYAYHQARSYRQAYGMFVANGILFNHESERRGETFVTRKVTRGLARVRLGLQYHVTLGNLAASRDWGYAPDYVQAMWLMLQHDTPDDFVIATGESHTVKDFVVAAVQAAGLSRGPEAYIAYDERYERPAEVHTLLGCAEKAESVLGWRREHTFFDMVERMVEYDLELAKKELGPCDASWEHATR